MASGVDMRTVQDWLDRPNAAKHELAAKPETGADPQAGDLDQHSSRRALW
jgi:hypothetical protein